METMQLILVAIAGLAVALAVAWLIMKLIVSGIAARMVGAVRDFIQRAGRDRRRIPRDTPDRRQGDLATPEADR